MDDERSAGELEQEKKSEDQSPVMAMLSVEEPGRQDGDEDLLDGNTKCRSMEKRLVELREGQTLRVGRSKTNDISIRNKNVSRFHAVFSASSTGVLLSDLSSLNGTLLNGSRISTPVDVKSGDIVTIGDTKITLDLSYHGDDGDETWLGRTQSSQLVVAVVTVLVVDVCGYTRISEALPPEEVAAMMDRWMQMITGIVTANGGEVDKYIGDCVMALWRGRHDNERENAFEAIEAGREMLRRSEELSVMGEWGYHLTYPWRCRVALNSGEALIGTLGGPGKRDYTVLGDSVNLAFRLEGAAKKMGVDFIFSDATADLVGGLCSVRDLGRIQVEGRKGEVGVFTLEETARFRVISETREKEVLEAAQAKLAELEQIPIVTEILERLSVGLPSELTFHSYLHIQDVLREAVIFAVHDYRSERELELLAIAAAYHDSGFLEDQEDHEAIGAQMAEEAMRRSGEYAEDEISLVRTMILDTRLITTPTGLKQKARTRLSEYLLDADLSNFGRGDFFERLDAHYLEVGAEREEELETTLDLMTNHDWCTSAARALRQKKKEENIAELTELIEKG